MSINFPPAPTYNQRFTENNVEYIWDGSKWTVNNALALPPNGGTGTDAWVSCSGAGDISGSFNVDSVTQTSEGNYDVVFTTPMPNANYCAIANPAAAARTARVLSRSTTGCSVNIQKTADQTDSNSSFGLVVNATNATLPLTGGTGTDAWAVVSASGNLGANFNIQSAVKESAGVYLLTFTTAMPSDAYAVQLSTPSTGVFNSLYEIVSGSQLKVRTFNSGNTPTDSAFSVAVNATNAQLPDTFTIEQFNDLVARVTALENA